MVLTSKTGGIYYLKIEWFWQKDDMPLFQKLITLYANIIIANKKNIIKTKVKGSRYKTRQQSRKEI